MRLTVCITTFALSIAATQVTAQELSLCRFNPSQLKFAGSPVQQASCLLRRVGRGAELGANPAELPALLNELIGNSVAVSKQKLRTYLSTQGIDENDIGGSLDGQISRANNNSQAAPLARYFVIHDTSTPNCSETTSRCEELGKLPTNRDEASWRYNGRSLVLRKKGAAVAHVYVARTGISKLGHDFSVPWRATRLEVDKLKILGKGLFLHIENVQPRIGDPAVPPPTSDANDLIAPNPGFTGAQYKRLALVYLSASIRRGEWLIPGFHAVIDSGISGAHDDPQNFDLNAFAAALQGILNELPR